MKVARRRSSKSAARRGFTIRRPIAKSNPIQRKIREVASKITANRSVKQAGRNRQSVDILYRRKYDGKVAQYRINPYSERDGRLFGDTDSGIRGFLKNRIIKAVPVEGGQFEPKWDVEL